MSWVLRMAWRDSRGQRRRLLLYTGAIAVGIAALTGLRGLSRSMERNIDEQAAALLGADMEIESDAPFDTEVESVIDSIGGRQARLVELNSMVYLPRSDGTRLAQVRALEGGYPFYGQLRTDPDSAAHSWQATGGALVDDGLMLQFDAAVGDTIRVGYVSLPIVGRLLYVPGETSMRSDIQPRVFIPLRFLQETGLVLRGSRVEYKTYLRFDDGRDVEALAASLNERFGHRGIDFDTVADRQRRLGRSLGNLYRFLGLGSFVSLLLGAVGVASAVHAHVQQKLETVAILRSLGATSRQALLIYLIQAGAMGLAGSLAGTVAGAGTLLVLPWLLADFLPADLADLQMVLSPLTFLEGILIGASVALLFAALPLLAVRRASPLLALRASFEAEAEPGQSDRGMRLVIGALILLGTLLLANLLAGRIDHALYFTGGTAGALGLLALAARLLRDGARRFFPSSWSYVWRQGLANLYRPQNQTLLLLVSLGLGTFLVAALYTAQSSILAQLDRVGGDGQPNIVLFDIQSDQRQQVADFVQEMGLPLIQQVPVVSMHIAAVRGRPVGANAPPHSDRRRGNWAERREYRVTYRRELADSEQIIAGTWHGVAGDTVFVSLDQGVAASLGVTIGDSLVFDVQGVPVAAVVGSLREVDWQRIMPNFLVVFPTGVLEPAPQFHVMVTRADDIAVRAELKSRAVRRFPNVSVIDLDTVLRTVDTILDKVSVVVRLMALFSIGTGLVVLVAVVSGSRFQRRRESALLRALGANRRQVGRILLVEYVLLGSLAGLTGLTLALVGGWGITRFVFDISFAPALEPLVVALVGVPLVTAIAGLSGSRGVHTAPPLEVLRRAD
jgi:putative ABC transport system permease protein